MKRAGWGALAIALVVTGCSLNPVPAKPPAPTNSAPATSSTRLSSQDPARFAPEVVRYAREADVNAQLLMAILYNESYKPHNPIAERQWQKIKPDAAFGVANMHRATYDETKRGRPFEHRDWEELPDDPGLAIQAAAWYLHDLAAQLPAERSQYTTDELLALGYNTGPANMKAFANGTKPGSAAQSYLDNLHKNWDKAGEAIRNA